MEQRRQMSTGLQMAALAHDLRTPVCVASGAAQMALEAGGADVSAQLRQILQAMRAMDRMLTMMSDTAQARGSDTFTGEMLRRELLAMTAIRAREKGQYLSVDLYALDGAEIEGDYAALCRLLTNLLGNAIKYTQAGGEITLRAQMERETSRPGYRRIRFIVADNGMGMKRGFMRRMFVPFSRAQGTAEIPGSGLGLAIVRDMAERMGGSIRVHSKWGKGTTFAVSVPVRMRFMS